MSEAENKYKLIDICIGCKHNNKLKAESYFQKRYCDIMDCVVDRRMFCKYKKQIITNK